MISKTCIILLVTVAFLPFQAPSVLGTEESREIAFERKIGREILDLDLELLNAIKVEGFISGPYVHFHLPAKLSLEYASNQVFPGDTIPLTFKFMPYDGSGFEFESRFGIKFGVDITVFEWDFGLGYDFEENFVPPMTADTRIPAKSVVDIWAKRVRCVGGYNLSLYGTELLEGDAIIIDLQIIEPAGGDQVYFETEGQDLVQISQALSTGENSVDLIIKAAPPYFGKIKIRADITEKFPIKQLGGYLKPGIGAHFVKDWFCNYHDLGPALFDWFEITPKLIKIPIDSTETEPLEWEFESKPDNIAGKIQDLILEATRLNYGTPPVIGEPDTLVTDIWNVHGTICFPYESIHLQYFIDEGTGLDFIGDRTLTPSDASLLNFNNGSASSICDSFIYEPDDPTYILKKSHDWPVGELYPRYVVIMSPDTAYTSGCNDWTVVSETPVIDDININLIRPANNIDIVPFDLPLPDFCLDSLGVDSPPYIQCGDFAWFEIGVSNKGVDWPPNMSLSEQEDYVYLVGRAIYMQDTVPVLEDTIDAMLITPMAGGSSGQCLFEYEIPGEPELTSYLPIHRIRFVFDVNGGNEPGQESVWEGDFDNNTMDTYQYFATYPDSALPSDSYYTTPQKIQPKLPPLYVYFDSMCHDTLYLYVADDEFLPVGVPGNVYVDIGLGDLDTSPRESSWTWYPCFYVGDFTDSDAKLWKVYVGDTGPFALTEYGLYSYCFRVSYNKYELDPFKTTHLYVDKDGACSSFEEDNYYYYSMAGNVYHEEDATGWQYKFEHLFQDNFPEIELDLESYVRADMAYDLRPADDPVTDPGDSIVVFCIAPDCTEIDTINGLPKIYMHVKCTYIGDPSSPKPALYGPSLEGTYGSYYSDDGTTWTIIQGEVARILEIPFADRYMFDLNDSLLSRGYQVDYYFKAHYTSGYSSTLPDRAESEDAFFEFTCLPTLASDILYVDDYHGIGSFDGRVQNYFDKTFTAVLPWYNQPDRYDVYSPDALISNGLGSRSKTFHLTSAYNTIIWDSGDLRSGTITDGTEYSDKSNDCQALIDWMDSSEHDVGLWICGDDIARDLDELPPGPAQTLMNLYCRAQFVNDSYFEMTGGLYGGGVAVPLVTGILGSPFHHVGPGTFDTCFAYGSYLDTCTVCDSSEVIKDFDVLDIYGGSYALGYPEYDGQPYYAAVCSTWTNPLSYAVKTMWFGFSFMHIRDYLYGDIALDRNKIARDVLYWMGHDVNEDITGTQVPTRYYLTQNYPNPFNPYTTIAFGMQEKGHVTLKIYNVAGQLIRTLVDGERDAGAHKVRWDGRNNRGATCASGVYFYMMKTKNFEQTKKIVLLR